MAIEDTKFVKSVEAKVGGKSGTYWTVTWTDGKFDTLFDKSMMDKCEQAQSQKLAVHYTKERKEGSKYFNIVSLDLMKDKLPEEPGEERILPQHQKVIEEAVAEAKSIKQEPPAPQSVGMVTKELGDQIRAGTLSQVFGKKIAIELTKWYRSQVLGITRITYEGKDLPIYKEEP